MSTEKLEEYKALYAEYSKHLINVHNYHYIFKDYVGLGSGKQIRTSLAAMMNLCRKLRIACSEAQAEHRENTKEQRKRLAELRKTAKPRKMPTGRPTGASNGNTDKPKRIRKTI